MKKTKNDSKNPAEKYSKRAWDYFWITTILTFFSLAFICIKFASQDVNILSNSKLAGMFSLNIFLGIVTFIVVLIKIKFKENKSNFFNKNIFIICLAYLLINSGVFVSAGYFGENQKLKNQILTNNEVKKSDVVQTPAPTYKPQKQKMVDSDSIIDCKSSSPNCNGSSIRVRKSQCSNITCCQIGSSWSVYPSSDECKKAQNNNSSGNYVYPTSKPANNTNNPTQTPTPTQHQIQPTATPIINVGQIVKDIESCQSDCSAEGSAKETKIQNYYRAQGGLGSSSYYQAISDNNAWVQSCINSCY